MSANRAKELREKAKGDPDKLLIQAVLLVADELRELREALARNSSEEIQSSQSSQGSSELKSKRARASQ